jgi:hypothetical protein
MRHDGGAPPGKSLQKHEIFPDPSGAPESKVQISIKGKVLAAIPYVPDILAVAFKNPICRKPPQLPDVCGPIWLS